MSRSGRSGLRDAGECCLRLRELGRLAQLGQTVAARLEVGARSRNIATRESDLAEGSLGDRLFLPHLAGLGVLQRSRGGALRGVQIAQAELCKRDPPPELGVVPLVPRG